MKKTMSPRKWIVSVMAALLAILLLMSALMYFVDPYFQFRVRDNTYLVNPNYANGGLIKNYDYDTLMIGSSMSQNFDMDLFRQELHVSPLHVSLGGLSALEMIELLELANSVGKAESYYLCIDLQTLMREDTESQNVPYLISQGPLSTLQYLLSHEAWFYSLPVCSALLLANRLDVALPESVRSETAIDNLGNWEDDYTCGEEITLNNYISGKFAVSEVDMTRAYEIAKSNIDALFLTLEQFSGEVNFFFPPYSGLYWYSKESSMDITLQVKHYLIEKAYEYGYCTYDFQGQDFISDLSNYRDTSHYGGAINDWMVGCFAKGECIVTPDTMASFDGDLRRNIAVTVEKYAAWLNTDTPQESDAR